jgi:hypothetical protein
MGRVLKATGGFKAKEAKQRKDRSKRASSSIVERTVDNREVVCASQTSLR